MDRPLRSLWKDDIQDCVRSGVSEPEYGGLKFGSFRTIHAWIGQQPDGAFRGVKATQYHHGTCVNLICGDDVQTWCFESWEVGEAKRLAESLSFNPKGGSNGYVPH